MPFAKSIVFIVIINFVFNEDIEDFFYIRRIVIPPTKHRPFEESSTSTRRAFESPDLSISIPRCFLCTHEASVSKGANERSMRSQETPKKKRFFFGLTLESDSDITFRQHAHTHKFSTNKQTQRDDTVRSSFARSPTSSTSSSPRTVFFPRGAPRRAAASQRRRARASADARRTRDGTVRAEHSRFA